MTAQIRPFDFLWATALIFIAAVVGLIAGYDPRVAVLGALGITFLLLMISDLRIGLGLFIAFTFLEMTAVVPGVGLAKLAGGALALSWLAQAMTNPSYRRFLWSDHSLLTWLVVAFLAWNLLSTAWAVDPGEAFSYTFRFLLNAALLPIVYTAVRNEGDLKFMAGAFVLGAGFTAMLALVNPPDLSGGGGLSRLTGTIGDPNELAATLAASFMLSVGLATTRPRGSLSRIAFASLGAILVLTLILTVSRGGVVALGAALLISPFLVRRKMQALAAIVGLLAVLALYAATLAPSGTLDRLQDRDGGSGRTDIWKVASRVIDDRPFAGVGSGNFKNASVEYVIQAGSLNEKRTLIVNPTVAHNMYLQVWAETGIVGLLLFLGILGYCFGAAVIASHRFRERNQNTMANLAVALALALVALFTAYFFLSEETGNKLWILLSLCPAILGLSRRAGSN